MADNFEVAHSSSEQELSEQKRHEVVAAQLRGEAKAEGRGPDAVVASVAAELESIGLEPDPAELHRRYEEIDPDVPELLDTGDDGAPPDAPVSSPRESGADGPVVAGTDAGREHPPVDDADPAPR
jgi:hypothetical protein